MAKPLPVVGLACLCEKVLTEKDGVITLVRLVDQFTAVVPPNLPEGFKPHISMTLVLNLRAAGLTGKHDVRIVMHGPTKAADPQDFVVEFPPGDLSAVNLLLTVGIGIEKFGNCRLDVLFDGEPLTTVPFRLIEAQAQTDAAPVSPR